MRITILILIIGILVATSASAKMLDTEFEIDWLDEDNFTIFIDGDDHEFNCNDIDNNNYNAYDVTLYGEVKYSGDYYDFEVEVNWLNGDRFRIETEDNDWTFRCEDTTSSNYNNHDDVYDFEIDVNVEEDNDPDDFSDTETAIIEAIFTTVIEEHFDYTDNITSLSKDLVQARADAKNFEDKWKTSEQEHGALKNEVVTLRNDNKALDDEVDAVQRQRDSNHTAYLNMKDRVADKEKIIGDEQERTAAMKIERDEADDKAGNYFLAALAAVGGLWYYFDKKSKGAQLPETDEYNYE